MPPLEKEESKDLTGWHELLTLPSTAFPRVASDLLDNPTGVGVGGIFLLQMRSRGFSQSHPLFRVNWALVDELELLSQIFGPQSRVPCTPAGRRGRRKERWRVSPEPHPPDECRWVRGGAPSELWLLRCRGL